MTALPSKHSSECHMATEEEDGQRTTPGREIWKRRCGQQDTSTAGARWKRVVCGQCSSHWEQQRVGRQVTKYSNIIINNKPLKKEYICNNTIRKKDTHAHIVGPTRRLSLWWQSNRSSTDLPLSVQLDLEPGTTFHQTSDCWTIQPFQTVIEDVIIWTARPRPLDCALEMLLLTYLFSFNSVTNNNIPEKSVSKSDMSLFHVSSLVPIAASL